MRTMKNYPTSEDANLKIVITVNSNKTLARIFDDKEVISSGVATCSYEDTFDFKTGAELALARAFEKLPKPVEVEWKVVKRDPKPGDYVRITVNDYPFDDRDTVLKVNSVDENGHIDILIYDHPKCKKYLDNHGGWFSNRWVYLKGDYEVVEKVEHYRKITRLPRVGDYVKIIESKYSYDSPEYMLKICEVVGNDRMVFGVSVWGEDHPGVIKMRKYNPVNAPTKCHWNHNFNTWEFYEKV